jgi:hypothetical protein
MTLPLKLNRRHQVTLFITLVLAGIAALSDAKMMEVAGILLFGFAFAWAFGSDSRVVHWLFLSVGVLLACGTAGLAWYIHQKETNLYAQKVAAFEQRIPVLAEKYPLHKQGQIILDKDLWDLEQEWEGAAPVKPSKPPQDKWAKYLEEPFPSGFTPDQEWTAEGLSIPRASPEFPSGFTPDQVWTVKMPDGHVRYFRNKRDADHFAEFGLFRLCDLSGLCEYGKTQKIWDEAWVAGLDLSEVHSDELPDDPPEPLWGLESHDWQVGRVVVFGVFLFALGLGLILGIRSKPLPT